MAVNSAGKGNATGLKTFWVSQEDRGEKLSTSGKKAGQTDRLSDRQTDRQTDRQKNKMRK